MSAYNELIKSFEKIRAYMREFYVYGFKSREEYDSKSLRSYDDERRRMESWLGEHMSFIRTPEGKSTFISIDSRSSSRNPLYKAWKAKSFTDKDITLHFIVLDILHSPEVSLSLSEITEIIDRDYLSQFEYSQTFDESTLRKKLKEYAQEGVIETEKNGKKTLYRRSSTVLPRYAQDTITFFSEVAPCGVVGSFLLDKYKNESRPFCFKHHYITGTLDSDVIASLFQAMREKREVTLDNLSRSASEPLTVKVVPLRVYISAQNGRQHLLAADRRTKRIKSLRIDYISSVALCEECEEFDELRARLDRHQAHMWGVNCNGSLDKLEHVEFTVFVPAGEEHIITRLEREKRCGKVERVSDTLYRFSADLLDSNELVPWVRTFICRIVELNFSNRTTENRIKGDLLEMYRIYGLAGGEQNDIQ